MADKIIGFMPPLIQGQPGGRIVLTVTPAARERLTSHALILLEAHMGTRLKDVHVAKVCGDDLLAYDQIIATPRLTAIVDARVILISCGDPVVTLISYFQLHPAGPVTRLDLDFEGEFVLKSTAV